MHYVTMHGQKQAAVPASNMVGKRSPHFTSGIQGKCLSGADTASKWKDCLHAYVCACGGGCVCVRPYEQERAFSYRINCTSMHLEAS